MHGELRSRATGDHFMRIQDPPLPVDGDMAERVFKLPNGTILRVRANSREALRAPRVWWHVLRHMVGRVNWMLFGCVLFMLGVTIFGSLYVGGMKEASGAALRCASDLAACSAEQITLCRDPIVSLHTHLTQGGDRVVGRALRQQLKTCFYDHDLVPTYASVSRVLTLMLLSLGVWCSVVLAVHAGVLFVAAKKPVKAKKEATGGETHSV